MKKPSVISCLTTLMLAAVVCSYGQEQVKDSTGYSLKTGAKYLIQVIKTDSNKGGGLTPAPLRVFPLCPLGVTQTIIPDQPGVPVSFAFAYSVSENVVKTSTDVTIEFPSYNLSKLCKEFSKLWAVDYNEAIIIGGERGNKNSWFKIEKALGKGEYTYKLTSSKGSVGAIPGGWSSSPHVGVTYNDDQVLLVKFKKFEETHMATTSPSLAEKLPLRMFPFF